MTSIMVQGLIQIVVTFLPPGVYTNPTQIMASSQAIPILGQMEVLLFRCPIYGLLVGAISDQGLPVLTLIMVQGL